MVDDDVHLLETVSSVLEREGLTCYRATCPTEALEIASRQEIETAILDMFLGQRTGLETLLELRRFQASVAAILMSGNLTAEIREEASRMGVQEVLDKPLVLADLRKAVSRLSS